MSKKITVLGATGNIGTALVHTLLQQGHQVTAVARASSRLDALAQAGATTQAGDAHDAAFLTEALRGADTAFLMIPPNPTSPDVLGYMDEIGEATAQAVRAAGLKQAVHLSSIGADEPAGTGPVVGLHRQEARLNAIDGLQITHLRPAYFMENLLANVGLIQHMGIAGSATKADVAFPMVATKDIAAKAAELLATDKPESPAVQYLLGPRDYSLAEATAAIGQSIGRPELPYVAFSYEDAKKGMVGAGLSENQADLYDEMTRNINGGQSMANGPRDAASTTPTTVEEFAQAVFAPAFKAAAGA